MSTQQSSSAVPVVRVAIGWRARDVERRSTASVEFPDDDLSAEILEKDPVALRYDEPRHGFQLPPGRFLRVNQAAGRVFSVETTPHLEALSLSAARALADSVGHLLTAAGWAHVPQVGTGAAAVDAAASLAVGDNTGFGVTHVGTWRVPRGDDPWAALPSGTEVGPTEWDGVEALVTVRPVGPTSEPSAARLILQVRLNDGPLGTALFALRSARRRRFGGEMQTLTSWDRQPSEPPSAR